MTNIHQFTPLISSSDGVSGSLFLTQTLLRSLGYHSEIYAEKTSNTLAKEVFSLDQFNSGDCALLLVHHSMGHDLEDWLASITCPRILVYHNRTPSRYFNRDSEEYYYSIKGRQQLQQWKTLFSGAICVSPYNREELEEIGYKNLAVIPLLVDSKRFNPDIEHCGSEQHYQSDETLILSVGRIVENKRQHLLLEALWYLKQMHPSKPVRLVLVGGTTSENYHHQLLARVCELDLEREITFTGKCSDGQLRRLYQQANIMWCASEHEGFCIPLIEANSFSLPIISFATSNIPDTLGKSGILIEEPNPITMAYTTLSILKDATLAETLIAAGTENLQRFTSDTLTPALRNYLEERGVTP